MSYNAKIRADAMSLNPIDDALFVKMAESLSGNAEGFPQG